MNDFAADVSVEILSSGATAFHDFGFWGNTWNGTHSTEGKLDDSLAFYLVAVDFDADPEAGNVSRVQQFSGNWTLASNGTLSYSAEVVPAVPVPAAVWLLGSAMIGLVGVARRKSEQA